MTSQSKRKKHAKSASRVEPGMGGAGRDSRPPKRWVLGWILLLGPISIILFLFFFGDMPWVAQQSTKGALDAADKLLAFGRDQLREGNLEGAYGAFQKALQIKPDYAKTYGLLGQVYYAAGDRDNAMSYLKKAIALNPPQKELYYNNLGILHAQKGELDTALVMFETALATGVQTASIYQNIGYLHLARRDYPSAVGTFREAVEHLPDLRSLYLEMLRSALSDYYGNEEKRETYQSIQAALQRGVSDADLAIYDEAIVRQYVQDTPKTAEHYKNLGEALQALGRLEEAEQNYATALQICSTYAPAHLQLGLLRMGKGDLAGARNEFLLALKYDPKSMEAQRALAELNRISKD